MTKTLNQTSEIKIDDKHKYIRSGDDRGYSLYEIPNKQILEWSLPILEEIWSKSDCDPEYFLDYLKEQIK